MAFGGGFGKKLGLGSTKQVAQFAANVGASFASGGVIPVQTTPIAQEARPQMIQQDPYLEERFRTMRQQSMPSGSVSGFFNNLGGSLGEFGSGVSSFLSDISPLTSLFGVGGGASQGAQGPARTIQMRPPEETSSSGEILGANLGLAGGLIQGGRALARSKFGQGLIGGAVGTALIPSSGGDTGGVRITRKMKSDVRRIYMQTGMNPSLTAQVLNQIGQYPRLNFDPALVFFILTKRFRNDGPVVTKAAVRKTRSTLRRMKGVVDMYNSVCKPTTRRTPMRRAAPKAVQLIKN